MAGKIALFTPTTSACFAFNTERIWKQGRKKTNSDTQAVSPQAWSMTDYRNIRH